MDVEFTLGFSDFLLSHYHGRRHFHADYLYHVG